MGPYLAKFSGADSFIHVSLVESYMHRPGFRRQERYHPRCCGEDAAASFVNVNRETRGFY